MTTSFTTLVEIEFTAGVWTDVSAWVEGPVTVDRSVTSVTQEAQPGTCSFTLACADPATGAADARFMPDSPLSPHYPNVVEDKRVRVTLTKAGGGTSSVRFLGWITSLVPTWAATLAESTVAVTATDGLGRLARRKFTDGWHERVARATESVWRTIPLKSSPTAGDGSHPLDAAPWYFYSFDNLSFVKTLEFTSESLSSTELPGAVRVKSNAALTGASRGYGVTAASASAMLWIKPVAGPVVGNAWSANGTVATFGDTSGFMPFVLRANIEQDLEVWSGVSSTRIGVIRAQGRPVHVGCVLTGSTITLYADGVPVLSTAGSAGALGVYLYEGYASTEYLASDLLLVGDAVDPARYCGKSIGSLADMVSLLDSLTGSLTTTTADSGMGSKAASAPALDATPTALDLAQLIAASEGSPVWDDGTGVRFTCREYQTSPAITIDVEADMDGPAQLARDAEGRVAIGKASNAWGSKQETDADLALDLGDVSGEVVTVLASEIDLDARASLRISEGRDAKTRLAAVAFDLATAANDLYAAFWALKPGQHARVTAIPSTLLGLTYVEQRVLGFTEVIDVGTCLVTLNLGTPIAGRPVQTVARHGFGEGVATLSAGITSSATTIAIAFTSAAGLSTSGADYPFAINVNGERMTLNSAPGGSTSPQTFTGVTRGVAPTVARAHSAGESVELWNPLQVGY